MCLHCYCHILFISSVKSPYYTWRSNMDACNAIEELYHHLHTQSHLNMWKTANVIGQIHNTWVWELEAHIDDHVHTSAMRYQRAWEASLDLQGHGDWEEELQVLDKSNVRALNEWELTMKEKNEIRVVQCHVGIEVSDDEVDDESVPIAAAAVGTGQWRPSWIWFIGLPTLQGDRAKSRTWADWWEEEVVPLCEEMHWCIMYCCWKASWWIEQQYGQATNLPEDDLIHKGLEVYSRQQALHGLKLMDAWEKHWLSVQQWAKPLLQWMLGDPLPEGLDVGDATGETAVIDLDEEIKSEHGLEYD